MDNSLQVQMMDNIMALGRLQERTRVLEIMTSMVNKDTADTLKDLADKINSLD